MLGGRRDSIVGGFATTMQSVPFNTDVVSSNLDLSEDVQHFVIKFISDLWQVGGFLHQ
jgi:hypothetical protein